MYLRQGLESSCRRLATLAHLSKSRAPNCASANSRYTRHQPALASANQRRYATECNAVRSTLDDVNIPDCNLGEFVWQGIDKWPDKTAVVCGISGRSYTYAELRQACSRFARSLRRAGFEAGQVLAIVLPNCPEYPVAMLGAVEAGMVVTTVNPGYVPLEIAKQLIDSGARVIVTLPEVYAQVDEATRLAAERGYRKPMIIVTASPEMKTIPTGAVNLEDMLDRSADVSGDVAPYPVTHETPVVIPYSSGTTGLPKGVSLSHRNIIANTVQMQHEKITLTHDATGNYQDCLPAILPFFHIFGLVVVLLSKLQQGAKIITLPKFEPNSFLNAVHKHKSTVLYLVPPLILFLGSSPAATPEHFKTVRYVLSGAAPLGEKDLERFQEKVPEKLRCIQAFGMTEASPALFHSYNDQSKLSSVGPCLPNTAAKIVDQASGNTLGPGEVGEVYVRGPQIMLGYYNNPKATADLLDKDGWLHTGDLGYYDDDKDFYIVDRLKELIKVKGMQVAPAELEELLRSHPDVHDAAVIGIPDERSGEVPLGYIVPKPNLSGKNLEEDLKTYVESKVSKHKHLTGGIRFVKAIPKSPAGKILRKILREEYKAEKADKC